MLSEIIRGTKTTLPANAKGQRMWYTYRYEPVMNMYVSRIDDAFGYSSEAGNFDYRYGMALRRTDLNRLNYETDLDNLVRIKAVRGPNELATGVPYIIAFDYQPKATFGTQGITAPAYAVTKHYDIQPPNDDMETVTFVDGFGRLTAIRYPDYPENNVRYHYGRGKLACSMPSAANRRVELNAKEFDEETGMYYYGARYYEPRLSLWMSVDPISNYDPRNSENYLDGEHNGGVVNAQNLNPYQYCYQNPVRYNNPNGMQVDISVHANTIELYQHLVFYGRQASSALSREISDNITYRFNKEKLTYSMNDRTYDVRLRTTYETVDIDKAIDMASTNKNNEVQFIRISNVQKSSKHSIGANSGWFSTNDDLGNSTTPAHEMAHGLGLYHQDGTKNPPSIIIPRGTRVAAEWSNDKNPRKGVNPSIRRWTNGGIKKILDKASWDQGRTSGRIGKATNIIFNHDSSERTWKNVVKQFFGLEKP